MEDNIHLNVTLLKALGGRDVTKIELLAISALQLFLGWNL